MSLVIAIEGLMIPTVDPPPIHAGWLAEVMLEDLNGAPGERAQVNDTGLMIMSDHTEYNLMLFVRA